jgi:hypothetical protein
LDIKTACTPRPDILSGTFNPEIFTASLSAVTNHYQGISTGIHDMYKDAALFFQEATYPTQGLTTILSDIFGRLSGDNSLPAIHRLETAFGGGKTHTLIACTHIAHKGKALEGVMDHLLPANLIPEPGEIRVAGIAGDEIPVHKSKGDRLVPYTLWGEMAFQLGGETLYRQVEADAVSPAAPGKDFFQQVFEGGKALVMMDELAQYAARLSAATPTGSEQLAAFLMALNGYARENPGIVVVLSLASASDAFSSQTGILTELLGKVTGRQISEDEALTTGAMAVKSVASVVSRDATTTVPVQAAEISRVLGKRLFIAIDHQAAAQTADQYMEMYAKNASMLPDHVTRADFKDQMVRLFPFHPTLIDFLNKKLATLENFQGTRGVLRVLALAVRRIWEKSDPIPMIHTCHLDLRYARMVNEIIGRTGAGDLLTVLNADIGGADTDGIEGGKSNAQLCDLRNPHPENRPMYVYTWKSVFLHSLVGRDQALGSNIFGLTELDALFEVSFPGLTPAQVKVALEEISNSAFYLRFNQGRYYASLEPSINIALSKIRRAIQKAELMQALQAAARKVVSTDVKTFHVINDVSVPEHIPDNRGRPALAMVALDAGRINVDEFVTTAGPNRPRLEQNLVFLLVPDTVNTQYDSTDPELFEAFSPAAEKNKLSHLEDVARTVLAMRRLVKKPQDYGINPRKLEEDAFKQRIRERENAMVTAVTQAFRHLWFPSTTGQITRKEIRTAGGEGGASVLEQIRRVLLEENELVTADQATRSHLTNLAKLFFKASDTIHLKQLQENFFRLRTWPILDGPEVFDLIIREGVAKDIWCLYRMTSDDSTRPDEFYSRDTGGLPFSLNLDDGYALVTREGAKQREWIQAKGPDQSQIQEWVQQAIGEKKECAVGEIAETVKGLHGNLPENSVETALIKLAQNERTMLFRSAPGQDVRPEDLISGTRASLYTPRADDVILTPARAAEKNLLTRKDTALRLDGHTGGQVLGPLLRRIGSLYNQGAVSDIRLLDLPAIPLPKGGHLRIAVDNAPPDSMKALGELFEVAGTLISDDTALEAFLEITDPQEDCPLVKEIRKTQPHREQES